MRNSRFYPLTIYKQMIIDQNIIWIDIETVPLYKNEAEAMKDSSGLYAVWIDRYSSWKPEEVSHWDWYWERSALFPEFSKIVCISVGRIDGEEFTTKSYYWEEYTILFEIQKLLNHSTLKTWKLGGHNIKWFDISFIAKRMIMNRLIVPSLLNTMWKKPREIEHIDTQELRQLGRPVSTSLELMCLSLGVDSPKQEISGKDVKDVYYWKDPEFTKMNKITDYCEADVIAASECHKKILYFL